jgi:phosphomevalonate kinase
VFTASAPGKLHLAGEYAVLDGAEAVVCAIDRRATARATGPGTESAFLDALADLLDVADPEAAAIVRRIEVDTGPLRSDTAKLGLGSSAAATVAACACALAGTTGTLDRDRVHALARAAHAEAQGKRGARGSGADVAAAVHGGVIAVTPATHADTLPIIRRLELPPLLVIAFWTGRPADTVTLVAAVAAAVGRPGVDAAISDIAHASEALVVAGTVDGRPELRRTAAAITAIAAGGDAIAALARATGLELEPPVIAAARRIAEPLGGAVKTTGAGGGDVAIAVVPPGADEAGLRAALTAAGAMPLDLRIEPRGVDIAAPEG